MKKIIMDYELQVIEMFVAMGYHLNLSVEEILYTCKLTIDDIICEMKFANCDAFKAFSKLISS